MTPDEAKVTIGRRTCDDDDIIHISIEDRMSGIRIVDLEMTLENFSKALTGLSYCSAKYRFRPLQYTVDNIGKMRETKHLMLNKPNTYHNEERRLDIKKQVEESGELTDGWMLFSDGCDTQQNTDKHKAILYRFVDKEKSP